MIRIRELATCQELPTPERPQVQINALRSSRDGSTLASCSRYGGVKPWRRADSARDDSVSNSRAQQGGSAASHPTELSGHYISYQDRPGETEYASGFFWEGRPQGARSTVAGDGDGQR